MNPCWLREHGLLEMPGRLVPVHMHPVLNACEGRFDRAHLIPKQRLRLELGKKRDTAESERDLLTVWACRRHHHLLDQARKLRIPRDRLPESVEQFAADHGLVWWLDTEYGPLTETEAA